MLVPRERRGSPRVQRRLVGPSAGPPAPAAASPVALRVPCPLLEAARAMHGHPGGIARVSGCRRCHAHPRVPALLLAGGVAGAEVSSPARAALVPTLRHLSSCAQVWDWSGALNRTGPVVLRGTPNLCLEPVPQPLVSPPQCSAAVPDVCWDSPALNFTFWTQSPAACCYACQLGRLSNDVDGLPLCSRWTLVNSTCTLYGTGASNATRPCPGAVAGLRAPRSGGAALPAPHQFAGGALHAAPCDGSPAQDWVYTGVPTTNATGPAGLLYGLVQYAGSSDGLCFSLSPDEGFRVGLDKCEPPQRGRQTPQSILYNATSGAAMSRAASATLHTPPWCLAVCSEA